MARCYIVGECEVWPDQRRILVSGEPAAIGSRAFDLLLYLIAHRERVVGKEELLEQVWRGLVVEEGNLTVHVSALRKLLGARAIATLPGRGYRFAVPIEEPAVALSTVVAAAARPNKLPAVQSALPLPVALFGRGADLDALHSVLAAQRLVTVLGAGGIGKTVFAAEAARREAAAGRRVAWVDLAPVADGTWLPSALASSLALPLAERADPMPALRAALRPVQALVVLDNAEHVIDAAAALAHAVLASAPGIRLLVTSQAPLRVEGERLFRLDALDVPRADAPFSEAVATGAVALFVDRARASNRRFDPSPGEVATIARLCRRLDGLPLAIKLAAGRLELLGLSGLEARLSDRLEMLAGNGRDAPARQQTLQAALDWSVGQLTSAEQRLFRRFAAFAGGFGSAFACAAGDDGSGEWPVLDALQVLVERSLLEVDHTDPPRYRMLECPRAYGWLQLAERGETEAAQRAHAAALERSLSAATETIWSRPARWLADWAPELGNVRAALDWSARRDSPIFVSLVCSSEALFWHLGFVHELRTRIAEAGDSVLDGASDAVACDYWLARSFLASASSAGETHDAAARSETLARRTGDRRALYLALGMRLSSAGLTPEAAAPLLAELRALEDPTWPPRARAQRQVAEWATHAVEGNWPEALAAAEAGLELALAEGVNTKLSAGLFANRLVIALFRCRGAAAAIERAIDMEPLVCGSPEGLQVPFIGTFAWALLRAPDLPAAKAKIARMFELGRTVDWQYFDFFGDLYPEFAYAEGRLDDAALLLGHAGAARRRVWPLRRESNTQRWLQMTLEEALGAETLAQRCSEGVALDPEAVAALVLGTLATPDSS